MSRRLAAALLDSVAGGADAVRPTGGPTRRFCYSKRGQSSLIYVIVDIDADGREEWAEQESGELAWYACVPSSEDRAAVLATLAADRPWRNWQCLDLAREEQGGR